MSNTFTEIITLSRIDCGNCGAAYALSDRFLRLKSEQGGFWTCPYCKIEWGYGKSENSRLKAELEATQCALRSAKCEVLSEKTLREIAEKKVRRSNRGLCTCCNRSFQNLARHMKTKHGEVLKGKL